MDAMNKYTPEQIVLALEILNDLDKDNNQWQYNTKELYSLSTTILLLLRHYKKITNKTQSDEKITC